jgi:hypothetical protein
VPISYPFASGDDVLVPDDWIVWAASDVHGVRSGFVAALQDAGLIGADEAWVAPAGTALVVCGDSIDRGLDSLGVLRLIDGLGVEARAAGGRVVPVRGNHEQFALDAQAERHPGAALLWLDVGGRAALESFVPEFDSDATRLTAFRDRPEITALLSANVPYARWRDVLFVHAGLPAGMGLDDLWTTMRHMFVRGDWFDDEAFTTATAGNPRYGRFIAAGVRRVVFGHTPQRDGVTVFHRGKSLAIDTDACAKLDRSRSGVSVVRIPPDGPMTGVHVASASTLSARDRMVPGSEGPGPFATGHL